MNAPAIPPQRKPERASAPLDSLGGLGRQAIWRAESLLAIRQLIVAFWPFALVFKIVLIAALLGLFPLFGPLVHTLLVIGSIVALLASFIVCLKRFQGVSEAEARRMVERASGLAHRPLTTLADTPAIAGSLWNQHREQAALAIRKVALQVPGFTLRGVGAPVLRYGSWLALLLALFFAWDEAPRRLEEASEPPVASLLPNARFDAWITPPAYTGQPPIALRAEQPAVSVPEGSTITVRVTGGWFPPVVELPAGRQRLHADSDNAYQYTAELRQAGRVRIRQDGHYLGNWAISLLQDMPPSIAFAKPPAASDQMALRLDYTASDDIGLVKVEAEIEPEVANIASPHLKPLVLQLPVANPPPVTAHAFRFFDLTANPLAGSKVLITLRAFDGKGQVGEAAPVSFTLPERDFTNPIAKALIRLRKELLVRGLAVRHPGVELVSGLAEEVEDGEKPDFIGALALRVIATRLKLVSDAAEIPGLERLMWDTALHFEDGGVGQAFNRMRQAQQALEDALNNGASDAEMQQLMQQLEQAMNDYLDQLQQQGQQPGQQGADQNVRMIDRQDLQNMLEQMRQLAQSGARDQAQQMLQQLQQMMENMQSGPSGPSDPQFSKDMQHLGEIARRQQDMMQSQPQNGQSPSGQQGAQQQEGLRRELGETMQGLSERGYNIDQLGRSEREMSGARDALQQGNQQEAAGQQGEALSRLREGMQSLQQQAEARAGTGGETDPFGRQPNGHSGANTSSIEIPDRDAAQRARQVLEELRRRSGDYSRPPDEREYLDRLLKWF